MKDMRENEGGTGMMLADDHDGVVYGRAVQDGFGSYSGMRAKSFHLLG